MHTAMSALALDPSRQPIGARCSGTLLLATLGLLIYCWPRSAGSGGFQTTGSE